MRINRLIVDSTNSVTDLCELGVKYPTDKSPYNKHDGHKHPYSAVYDLLFMNFRYQKIKLGEGGIAENMSMKCWRDYFPYAELHGFEWDPTYLQKGKDSNLSNTVYHEMNVKAEESIKNCLEECGGNFDILIDDTTHIFDDQIKFINVAYRYLNPNGLLIVEDIFRSADERKYVAALDHLNQYFSSATFIVTDHKLRYSPGWDNDKLLVLSRNEKI